MLDFNTEPYFNDFDENNKFYSILFRPSVAVQARELNQFQTILQDQIKKQGDHIFKNGTVVIPGEFSINSKVDYVKLADIGNLDDITTLIGLTITTATNIEALVVYATAATDTDLATLFVNYTKTATDTVTNKFAISDELESLDGIYTGITVSSDSAAIGFGSTCTVQKGVYYINGYFVLCDSQTIVLDKYTFSPTYRIGFDVVESTVTSDDAGYESLLDNAQGSYNYAAPGAHRYFIDLILSAITIDASSENFVELGRVVAGNIISASRKTEYSEIEKTFARRTYDESGNYSISRFEIDVREHRNNDRGSWDSAKSFLAGDVMLNGSYYYMAINNIDAGGVAPTHTSGIVGNWQQLAVPYYNRGIYSADAITPSIVGDASKLAIGFEPGKAYVQGYEIEKISTSYLSVEKPRDTLSDNNASIATSVGSYVQVTDVRKLPPMTSGLVVSLYDSIVTTPGTAAGSVIGTCRVRGIQSESGTGSTSYVRMFIYDVKMNTNKNFARDVKSFYFAANSFTANVTPDTYSVSVGSVTYTGTTTSALVGFGTKWLSGSDAEKLKSGDWVYFGIYKAQIASAPSTDTNVAITSITTAATITTPVAIARIQTQLVEPYGTSLVFPLPHYATQSISDHNYYIVQPATIVSAVSNTLNISVPAGTLLPDSSNYYVQDATGNSVGSSSFSVVASGSTAALTFGSAPSTSYTVFCTVNKVGVSSRKIKTLTTASKTFTLAQVAASTLTLDYSDCYKLVNVMSGTTDISDWFFFDDGQRDAYYDYGKITLKPSYPTPSTSITVNYQYFAHSTGDFCDLGSYTNIGYEMIPYYSNNSLRDVIDFRPRMDSFNLNMPKRGYNMSVDLSYYLGRIDKIALDINGNFFNIKGSSSLNPGIPSDPSTGMLMCTLNMAPYTYSTKDTSIVRVDNKRYTMRDIGRLEKRIDNLEYYTSLSLLEQETSSLSVTDAKGLDRFKNGFIVDNFTGHNIGDTSSSDYVCAVDMENGELRPFSYMNNVNLLLNTVTSTNYKLYGDVVTLPLDPTTPHIALAKNAYASRTEFVNPFAVFTFIGDVKMNPSSDEWFEVDRRPDIIQNVEGNFNTISTLAEKSGVLGTVWNSWQNQWYGAPVVVSSAYYTTVRGTPAWGIARDSNTWANQRALDNGATQIAADDFIARFGGGAGADGLGPARQVTTQTLATQVGQSRSGVNTKIVTKIDNKVVDDRILSTAVIPYIRSRNILIQTKGLKPNTRFYPFFDNTDISAYCTPATVLTYTPVTGDFDTTSNAGIDATVDIVRRINGDTQVCLNIGDVITGATSGVKAVLVGKEREISNTGTITYKLYVLNKTGTFTLNETITGSISGSTGKYLSTTVPTTYVTGLSGDLNLIFNIPNTNAVRFRTGSREFKLVDTNVATGEFTSRGRKDYVASGTIQTKQATVVSTRNAEIVQEAVTQNQVVVQSSERVVSDTGWYDPLAQTFLVDSRGGAMLSKVDLFFASKDNNIPVAIEIREVVNGYPGKTVLPFSRVTVKSEDVKLSSTKVTTFDGVSYPKYDTPTTIMFPSPIYVQDKTEYALVVLSDSNKYKIWISQVGDDIPGSSDKISEQPYNGVLFKSQNGSTWTADQTQDMKFTIWKANFDITKTSNVVMTNDLLSKVTLESNPIQTLSGSSTLRVWHNNHGLKTGEYVTLSDATSTDLSVTAAVLNQQWQISNPSLDSYTVVIANSITAGSFVVGGKYKITTLTGTSQAQWNTAAGTSAVTYAIGDTFTAATVGAGTGVVSSIATTTGFIGGTAVKSTRSVRFETLHPSISAQTFPDTTVAYTTETTELSSGLLNAAVACITNDNNYYPSVKVIPTGATGKLNINAVMSTTNASLSPIIDTHGCSAIAVTNKVDSPTELNTNIASIDNLVLFTSQACTLTGSTLTANTSTYQDMLKRVIAGTYIMFTGSATNTSSNGVKLLVTAVNYSTGALTLSGTSFTTEATASLTVNYYNAFFDEITPVGSSTASKYVSKVISLANQATMLRVRYAVNCPTEADVLVYYKTSINGTDMSTVNWTLFAPDKTMPKTAIGTNSFYDVDYTIESLIPFDILSVKLVMKSTNTAAAPRAKDLRIIACA